LPFSPGARAGDLVFVSGQASVDETGAIVSDTFRGEMERSIRNLQGVLAGAGLALNDVVRVNAYVADPDDLAEYNSLYADFFAEPRPARTTLTGCLVGIKFEIDAIAVARGQSEDG
jgi:2-iminobutanoate/2-iminopropanoate deaminase